MHLYHRAKKKMKFFQGSEVIRSKVVIRQWHLGLKEILMSICTLN